MAASSSLSVVSFCSFVGGVTVQSAEKEGLVDSYKSSVVLWSRRRALVLPLCKIPFHYRNVGGVCSSNYIILDGRIQFSIYLCNGF